MGSPFVAVGCWDNTVRILSLDHDAILKQLSLVTSRDDQVCVFARMAAESRVTTSRTAGFKEASLDYNLYLHISLQNGVMHRLAIDAVSESTSGSRVRVLGVNRQIIQSHGTRTEDVLALQTWLNYFIKADIYRLTFQRHGICF